MEYKIFSKYSNTEINNDGLLTDPIWNNCQSVDLRYYDNKELPDFLKTNVKSIWTDKNLYIGFEGKYDVIRTASPHVQFDALGKTMELWDLSDVYEIFIGPDSREKKIYRELQISPDNRWIDLTLEFSGNERLADFKWTSGMIAKSRIDRENKIWTAVFQIPYTAFDEFPKEGSVWNCNFYRIHGEGDRKTYLSWSPVMEVRFHQPDKFGDIVFIK
jgi:hypothetical protein